MEELCLPVMCKRGRGCSMFQLRGEVHRGAHVICPVVAWWLVRVVVHRRRRREVIKEETMVSSYHVHDKHALYVKLFFFIVSFFFFSFFVWSLLIDIPPRRGNFWNDSFDRFDLIKEIHAISVPMVFTRVYWVIWNLIRWYIYFRFAIKQNNLFLFIFARECARQASLFACCLWKVASVLVNHLHARSDATSKIRTAIRWRKRVTLHYLLSNHVTIRKNRIHGGERVNRFRELETRNLIELIVLLLKISVKYLSEQTSRNFHSKFFDWIVCSNGNAFPLYSFSIAFLQFS